MIAAIETALVEILVIALSFSMVLVAALAYNRYVLKKKISYLLHYVQKQTNETIAAQQDIELLKQALQDMKPDQL